MSKIPRVAASFCLLSAASASFSLFSSGLGDGGADSAGQGKHSPMGTQAPRAGIQKKRGRGVGDGEGLSTLGARKFLVGTQARRGVVWFAEGSWLLHRRHRKVSLAVGLPQ